MTPAPSAAEIIVEYEFHCFCGAPIATTGKTVTCSSCGSVLGIRRSRRQHWKIHSLVRPYRRLQVSDLKFLAIRITLYLLSAYLVYDLGRYLYGFMGD